MKTIILGAGFAGLAAGIKTGATIYEASDHAGGICRSYVKEGFQFNDGGGHWIFGKGPGLDFIKSIVPVKDYVRKAGVYYNHTFPYPIQTAAQAPIEIKKDDSLKAWLSARFSREECNLFFNPFNEKYTCGLYDDIIQFDEFKTPPAGSKGYVATFSYPENGLDDLVDKMAAQCNNIQYGWRAEKVDLDRKVVWFTNGEMVSYDRLISTIPLNQLLDMCGKKDVRLPYTSVLVLNIGAEKSHSTPDQHWMYIPFCKTGFFRIQFYSNIEHTMAPNNNTIGLCVEMSFKDVEYDDLDIDYITYHVVRELQMWGWIGKTIVVDPTWVKTAYTWLHKIDDRQSELDWLKDRGVISTGRYGKWAFQGMIDSIKDGLEVNV